MHGCLISKTNKSERKDWKQNYEYVSHTDLYCRFGISMLQTSITAALTEFHMNYTSKSEWHNLCISLWQLLLMYINHTLILAPQKIHFNRCIPACLQVVLGLLPSSPPPTSFFFFLAAEQTETIPHYCIYCFFSSLLTVALSVPRRRDTLR